MAAISKKETAKVAVPPSGSKPILPQATVQLQKPPTPPSKSVGSSAISVQPATQPAAAGGEVNTVLGAAALVVALIAFLVQVWMLLG
jgi:hypothetical protein